MKLSHRLYSLCAALVLGTYAVRSAGVPAVPTIPTSQAVPVVSLCGQQGGLASLGSQASNVTYLAGLLQSTISGIIAKESPALECDACLGLLAVAKAIGEMSGEIVLLALCEAEREDQDVCIGLSESLGPSLGDMATKLSSEADAQLFCNRIIGLCNYPPVITSNLQLGKAPTPKAAPAVAPTTDYLTVLHLTDWHFDPLYVKGTEAACTKPLCCRGFNTTSPNKASRPAASWGDYNCDAPEKLGISLLQSVPGNLGKQPDFSVLTGDLPPHNVWLDTPSNVVSTAQTANAHFHQYLKNPVYPSVGNHETAPVNIFYPTAYAGPTSNNQYLFDSLTGSDWTGWLNASTLSYARTHQGSYSVNVRPGLRLISINSEFCYVDNFPLYVNSTNQNVIDPNGQLAWVAGQLQAAEAAGQKVWIIAHVAPGLSDCLRSWSNLYNTIVQRYYKTIAGQFYGHTHRDEMQIWYSSETKNEKTAISAGYVGPSATPYTELNAGYRVYKVHPVTFEIMDSLTYVADISQAAAWDAANKQPVWKLEYSARDYLPSWPATAPLNGTFWELAVQSFQASDAAFQKYFLHRSKSSGLDGTCTDAACKADIICGIRAGNSADDCTRDSPFRKRSLEAGAKPKWARNLCKSHVI